MEAEYARVEEAFAAPAISLLSRTRSPVIIAVFLASFDRDHPSVPEDESARATASARVSARSWFRLTEAERAAYDAVTDPAWALPRRLKQERIPLPTAAIRLG